MRLQGMDPTKFVIAVTGPQLKKQLGHTMSVNVSERLLKRVLPAAGLAKRDTLFDRWENGEAVKQLSGAIGHRLQDIRPNAGHKVAGPVV